MKVPFHQFALLGVLALGALIGALAGHFLMPAGGSDHALAAAVSTGPASQLGSENQESPHSKGDAEELPEIARRMNELVELNERIHAARARFMSSEERVAHIKKRILETDMVCWVWVQTNVADLSQEISQYILPEDYAAVLKMAAELPGGWYNENQRFVQSLVEQLARTTEGVNLTALAATMPWQSAKTLLAAAAADAKERGPFAVVPLLREVDEDLDNSWFTHRTFIEAAKADPERAFREAGGIRSLALRKGAYAGAVAGLLSQTEDVGTAWKMLEEIEPLGLRHQVRSDLFGYIDVLVTDDKVKRKYLDFVATSEFFDDALRQQAFEGMFSSGTAHPDRDIKWARENAKHLEGTASYKALLGRLIGSKASHNAADTLDWALKEEGMIREIGVQQAVSSMASKNLQSALDATAKLSEAERALVRTDLVKNWAEKSPKEAAAWVTELGDVPDLPEIANQLVGNWARNDALAASEWVDQLEQGAVRDAAAVSLVSRVAYTDPEGAGVWALQIQDTGKRSFALQVVTTHGFREPDKARAWVEANAEAIGAEETQSLLKKIGK